MRITKTRMLTLAALPLIWVVGLQTDGGLLKPVIAGHAQAVVGRPLSPVSVGGVARRTTRRTVAYSSTANSSAAASSAAAADASAAQASAAAADASASQAAAAAASTPALPTGTVVSALPAGCTSTQIDGGSYFNCGGTIYQPTFQSNNLVYVVK